MIRFRVTAGARAVVALAAVWAAACSSEKKTLLLVNVSLGDGVTAPTTISLAASSGTTTLGSTDFPWSQASNGVLRTGIYLPDRAAGSVTVVATGTTDGQPTASGSQTTTIQAGQTNGPLDVQLQKTVAGSVDDGGAPEAGAPPAETDALASDAANPDGVAVVPDGGGADVPAVDGKGSAPPETDGGEAGIDSGVSESGRPASDGPEGDIARDASAADAPSDASPPVAWQAASNVENDPIARSYGPVIAVEPTTENVFVAWQETTAAKVKRWDRQLGTWGPTKTLENRGAPMGVTVGTDAEGHIIAAWFQNNSVNDKSLQGVWVCQSSDGVVWSAPQKVVSGSIYDLQLAVARNGVARMAYSLQIDSYNEGLFTAYFDGTSWTANPDPVLDPNDPGAPGDSSSNPQLAIGGNGDGIVIFDQYDTSYNINVGVVNLIGSTRSTARILNHSTADNIYERHPAMNRGGAGVVAWAEESSPNSMTSYVSTYQPADGSWSTPQRITDSSSFALLTAVLDDNGLVTLAWVQSISTGGYNVMAMHESAGGVWGDITPLETDNVASMSIDSDLFAVPNLVADASGNVLAVWSKEIDSATYTYGAYARRLQGEEWQPQVKLGQKAGLRANDPTVAVADSGFGAASFVYVALPDGTTSDPEAYNVEVAFCR